MFVSQKYRFNLIFLSIFIVFISNLSGTNLKGGTSTIFKDASVRIDDNQRAPLEVKFQEGQNVSVTVFFELIRKPLTGQITMRQFYLENLKII